MGIWAPKKALIWWINSWWRPKGKSDLKLRSKGFFTVIFATIEGGEWIFKEGPYFFNLAGLHPRYWVEKFNLKNVDFTPALVWIKLYSLPREFWDEETLAGTGKILGSFVKTLKVTRMGRYTTHARICVNALPKSICINFEDSKWVKTLDYKHILSIVGNVMSMAICLGTTL